MSLRSTPKMVSARLSEAEAFGLDRYIADGGYDALRKAVLDLSPADVHAEVRMSRLTGRSGGQAFPTASKWDLLAHGDPKYLVVNADESEPGFFKDRLLVERDPHEIIEGALLCAYAIGAETAFVYVRGEFALGIERLENAVAEARAYGAVGRTVLGSAFSCEIVVHPGAGAYICGEETALIESLEGKRGFPRPKPPYYPAAIGLYGKPTVVNNVETLTTLPWIVRHGGAEYATWGGGRFAGTRLFCLSGNVARPGAYEVELHHPTFRDLLYDPTLGGGLSNGAHLRAFIPGASFPWFFPEQLDVHLDGDEVSANGSSLGSGVIVLDSSTCPVRAAWRLVRFYASESCGQCTPCREGTSWMEKIMRRIEGGTGRKEDIELLLDLSDGVSPSPFPHPPRPDIGEAAVPFPYSQTTICPLGPSAIAPVDSSIWRFRDDYLAHVEEGACPYR